MDKELAEIATLGKEADFFINSNIGKILIQRSNDEVDLAVADFKAVDVSDIEAVRKIQNRMMVAEKGLEWVIKQIMVGKSALQQLEMEHEMEGE